MKKFAIVYGEAKTPLQKKAIEVLSTLLQDYNIEYPTCYSYDKLPQSLEYRYIYIGTLDNNPILKEKIEIYLPKWENITGLHCDSWQTKYMTTRWGTCNTNSRKIWFNLQLAKKPLECLEYVILHELVHLVEKTGQ